ncbi:MAG TPA: isoleucine--tRNA ligase, partial [Planctomycetaceae bacterium]|nr:isoleucine--tRNA ligase [Planctomycetaceae bacterium]
NEQGTIQLPVADETLEFDAEDIQVRLQAKPGWAAAQGSQCVVVLATELTDALIREGYARDLVRSIQDRRKQLDCQFTDRIQIGIVTDSTELQAAIAENQAYITTETLAMSLVTTDIPGAESVTTTIGDAEVTLYVAVANDNPPTS